jgi:hypothetical protein
MTWTFDANFALLFRHRTSFVSLHTLDNTTVLAGSPSVREDKSQYRNHQILRAGTGLTDTITEEFVGDNKRKTFNVAFKIGQQPVIKVNDVEVNVGIRGISTANEEWHWAKGETEISHKTDAEAPEGVTIPPLDVDDILTVEYRGQYPIVIDAELTDEIALRKSIEGGSGRYTHVEDRPNIDTIEAAHAAVNALLARHGRIPRILTCQTRLQDIKPGQLVATNFPQHNLTEEVLVLSVSAGIPRDMDEFVFSIRGTTGDVEGGWREYWRRLHQQGRQYVIRENEIVVQLISGAEGVLCDDDASHITAAKESRIGHARVGFSVIGPATL